MDSIAQVDNLENSEIIIVDNSNSEEEFEQLKQTVFEKVNNRINFDVIKSKINLGFAGGINFGLSHARKKDSSSDFYVWVLNPDTKIENNSLPELLKTFIPGTHSVVGSIIKDYNGKFIIASHGEFNPNLGRTVTKSNNKIGSKYFYPIGASLLTSNLVLRALGDFDEQYFLYFEELDFVLKGLKENLHPAIAENSFIHHSQGATTKSKSKGNKNLKVLEFKARGLKKLYSKHFPKLKYGLIFGLLFKAFTFVLKGEFKGAKIFFKQIYLK